ncbi:CstA-like transporter-associated (seleno)protein [Streptomyces sp. M19]
MTGESAYDRYVEDLRERDPAAVPLDRRTFERRREEGARRIRAPVSAAADARVPPPLACAFPLPLTRAFRHR